MLPKTLTTWTETDPKQRFASAAFIVLGLIAIDQLTKLWAAQYTHSAEIIMANPGRLFGLGWHLHQADGAMFLDAFIAFSTVGIACLLPLPRAVKILWVSAAISNHAETLARPGTVDFIDFRLGAGVYSANVADIYVAAGIVIVAAWVVNVAWHSKGLFQPIHA